MGCDPKPGKCGQKKEKKYLQRSPTNPKPKTKIIFFDFKRRLAESEDGLNSSLAQSGGVTALQTCAKILAGAGVKGLNHFTSIWKRFKVTV